MEYGYYARQSTPESLEKISSIIYNAPRFDVTSVIDNRNKYSINTTCKVFLGIINTSIIFAFIIEKIFKPKSKF
jgi:hypothetical protein